tara:strand:+ start:4995 stop:5426 length:432 start_codon:yes stop_codon:yes gene_type:complete
MSNTVKVILIAIIIIACVCAAYLVHTILEKNYTLPEDLEGVVMFVIFCLGLGGINMNVSEKTYVEQEVYSLFLAAEEVAEAGDEKKMEELIERAKDLVKGTEINISSNIEETRSFLVNTEKEFVAQLNNSGMKERGYPPEDIV